MKDRYADRGAVEIETPPGSVDLEAHFAGGFPVQAFQFDRPHSSNPRVRLRSGWSFMAEGYDLMDRIEQLEARLVALGGWWHKAEKVSVEMSVHPVTVSVTPS